MKTSKITKEFLEEQIRLGKSVKEISEENQIKTYTIYRRCKNLNLEINPDKTNDIENQEFNWLKVIKKTGFKKYNSIEWECECKCGNKTFATTKQLKSGDKKSCGCSRDLQWKGCGEISGTYWGRLQSGAKKRGLEFTITIEYAWELFLKQDGKCKLSRINLFFFKKRIDQQNASLDRIDSTKGYIEGNVQWLHKKVNNMKNVQDQLEFINLCKMIAQNN